MYYIIIYYLEKNKIQIIIIKHQFEIIHYLLINLKVKKRKI